MSEEQMQQEQVEAINEAVDQAQEPNSDEPTRPDAVPMDEIVQAAEAQGWSPDKGDLGPLEFLAKGREFRDRMYNEIKSLREDNDKAYKVISEFITEQKQEKTQSHEAQVKAAIREATENGEVERVEQLTDLLAKIRSEGQAEAAKPKPETQKNERLVQDWIGKNRWFNENAEMKDDAIGFYQAEIVKNGGVDDAAVILPKVEQRMRKLYKSYFEPQNPNRNRNAGAEGGGKQRAGKRSGLTRDDLTPAEAAHLDQFVQLGMKEDKLLRSIENERKRRGQ